MARQFRQMGNVFASAMTAAPATCTPASRSAPMAERSVAPVVTTSSTRMTGRPVRLTLNLDADSSSLPRRSRPRWAAPPLGRLSRAAHPTPSRRAAPLASTRPWSRPRRRTASGREATGTSSTPCRRSWCWRLRASSPARKPAQPHAPSSLNVGMIRSSRGRYGAAAKTVVSSPGRLTTCVGCCRSCPAQLAHTPREGMRQPGQLAPRRRSAAASRNLMSPSWAPAPAQDACPQVIRDS